MIFLLTGANGAGKSAKAVSLILEILETNKNPDALEYPEWVLQFEEDDDGYLVPIVDNPKPLIRMVFSNISGLNMNSDQVFSLPPGNYDWQTLLPWGAVVFDDECHRRYPATGKPGAHESDIVNKLDMHRHRGLDFYFMTQFPNKLHHVIRNLVSQHIHLQNAAGSKGATVFTWMYAESNPNDYNARQGADKSVFVYRKKYFDHYKSTSLNTRTFKMPLKMWLLVFIIGIPVLLLVYRIADRLKDSDDILVSTREDVPLAAARTEVHAVPAVVQQIIYSGCIANNYDCICYDQEYKPIDMDFSSCKNILESPLRTIPIIKGDG